MNQQRFHYRGFVSFLMTLAFTVLTVSGGILYISPRGRVANWSGWSVFSIEKEDWAALHMVLALLVVVAAVFHLVFNWGIFWGYVKTRMTKGLNKKRELAAAVVVTAVVVAGTLSETQPFRSVTLLSERFKDSWETKDYQAPYPHAELSTITDYAKKTGSTAEQVTAKFAAKGIQVANPEQTIGQVAEANHTTPQALFIEAPARDASTHEGSGTGPGRKTITQLAAEQGLGTEAAVAKLKASGIEAGPDETLRTVADRAGKNPHDLLALLKP